MVSGEVRYEEYAERLQTAMSEMGVKRHQRASTIALWCDRETNNPEFARRWLRGHNMPREADQVLLADKLNVSVEWLKFGSGSKEIVLTRNEILEKQLGLAADHELLALLCNMTQEEVFSLKQFLKIVKK